MKTKTNKQTPPSLPKGGGISSLKSLTGIAGGFSPPLGNPEWAVITNNH